MLHLPRTTRPTAGTAATLLAAMLLALAPAAAHADDPGTTTDPTPATVAAQLCGGVDPADIEHVQASPDRAHVLYRRTERWSADGDGTPRAGTTTSDSAPTSAADPAPADDATPTTDDTTTTDERTCSDLWVVRTGDADATRLSDTCASNPAYGPYTANEQWSPDGAVTYFSGMAGGHYAGTSSRWTLADPGTARATTDLWAEQTFRGAGIGYTPDDRFWILRVQGWAYATTEWTAVRLSTGVSSPVWEEARQGDGHWSAACRTAPAPQSAPSAPTFTEVVATLTGDAPDCTFAPATPILVTTADPRPSTPVRPNGPVVGASTGPAQTALVESTTVRTPSARVSSASVSSSPLRTPPTDKLRIRAVGRQLPATAAGGRINVKFDAPGAVSAKAWLIVGTDASGARGKRLRSGTTLARGSASRLGIGTSTLPLRYEPSAHRLLRGARTVRAFVRVATTDAAGVTTLAERDVDLTR